MKKKKSKNFVLPPRRALLVHPVQKFLKFFALINKIYLQTLAEIILRYHHFFFSFGTSWSPSNKMKKMKISHMECLVSK